MENDCSSVSLMVMRRKRRMTRDDVDEIDDIDDGEGLPLHCWNHSS